MEVFRDLQDALLYGTKLSTDLRAGNVLIQLPSDMRNMTLEQLRVRTGEPDKELVVREDEAPLDPGVPPELVIPLRLGIDCDKATLADAPIQIADLGEVFDPRRTKQYTAQSPLLLAPPEARFANAGDLDEPLSFPSDVWTLACTISDTRFSEDIRELREKYNFELFTADEEVAFRSMMKDSRSFSEAEPALL
jgi:hypothetical protein